MSTACHELTCADVSVVPVVVVSVAPDVIAVYSLQLFSMRSQENNCQHRQVPHLAAGILFCNMELVLGCIVMHLSNKQDGTQLFEGQALHRFQHKGVDSSQNPREAKTVITCT